MVLKAYTPVSFFCLAPSFAKYGTDAPVRKSNTANLAFWGMTLTFFGRCFLSKATFDYACTSGSSRKSNNKSEAPTSLPGRTIVRTVPSEPPPKRPEPSLTEERPQSTSG